MAIAVALSQSNRFLEPQRVPKNDSVNGVLWTSSHRRRALPALAISDTTK